jgi:tetratricopeptide (TPR) repeat protein
MLLAAVCVLSAPALEAQEISSDLPLKRELPPPPPAPCDPWADVAAPDGQVPAEDRREAERLLAEANRAALLGERERAGEFLRRAQGLDPASAAVAYRLGRVLEEEGDDEAALEAFCRYLALEPDGQDVEDARMRTERLSPREEDPVSPAARSAFDQGVAAFDAGDLDAAARHFSRALVEEPGLDDAHYNRGVTYLRMGRIGAGAADLEWYLEANPRAPDRGRVEAQLAAVAPALEPSYSAGTALATGLLVPGMGHFYSGRPGTGFLVLATATTGVAVGLLHTNVEVECLSVPADGQCPPGDVLARHEDRPFLVPGVAAAAAATVIGAIHAFRGVRTDEAALAASGRTVRLDVRSGGPTPFVSLEPLPRWEGGGARASLGIRF